MCLFDYTNLLFVFFRKMEIHINPEERFDNDPLHLPQIGQANQVEKSTFEMNKLSLQDNEDLNSYPPAPLHPLMGYKLTHQAHTMKNNFHQVIVLHPTLPWMMMLMMSLRLTWILGF